MTTALPSAPTQDDSASSSPPDGARRVRTVVAIAAGLVAFIAIEALSMLGAFSGWPSIVLAGLLAIGIPSARDLTRRLAINGVVILGFLPIAWWIPWSADWGITHSGVLLGGVLGSLVAWAIIGGRRSIVIVPVLGRSVIALAITAAFLAWFFRQFFVYTEGLFGISLLRQAFGNDNVAHFDMFEMIRRYGSAGPTWPDPTDGTTFAYVPYPQHFHALVAQVAELVGGPTLLPPADEVGLFLIGSAVVIMGGIVTLLAAFLSLPALRNRPGLSLIVAAGVVSFLLLGLGANALDHGFPPYLLAIIGTLLSVAFAMRPGRSSASSVLGSAAATVLVAHTWSLLAPLAAVALLWCLIRLPWGRASLRGRVVAIVIGAVVIVGLGGGWALYLVVRATSSVGSFSEVLAINGAATPASIPLMLGLGFAVIGTVALLRLRRTQVTGDLLIAIVAILGIAMAAVLIAVQLSQEDEISYFQIKFMNALCAVLGVLVVVLFTLALAQSLRRATTASTRAAAAVKVAAAIAVVLLASGIPVDLGPAFAANTSPGLVFREQTQIQAQTHFARNVRLLEAVTVMASEPCVQPVYLGAFPDDLSLGGSNQWAMSLSSTWTEASAPVNSYLFSHDGDDNWGLAPAIARHLLDESSNICLVVDPEARAYLAEELDSSLVDRIVTW